MARLDNSMQGSVQAQLLAAADAFDRVGDARSPQEKRAAVMEVFKHREALQIVAIKQQMDRLSNARAAERLPLREGRDDFGRVEARIPKDLYFHLRNQRNFGDAGFESDEGMRDFLKAYPACRVKTVSGKTTVGWEPTPRSQKPEARSLNLRGANFNGLTMAN